MKYAIENTHGQWWSGICWGVEQVRKVYESLHSVPRILPAASYINDTTWLLVNSSQEPLDAIYFDLDDETVARVYEVS